jgi:carbonic anhydrase
MGGLPMSKIVSEVLEANRSYAQSFGKKAELGLPPARGFAILTCMDARLDPAKYAGLAEGDAHVIRNAGGRATEDAIRSLIISHKLLGTNEWFVVHHTNCGMELFSDDIMAELLEDDLATASFDGKKWSNPHHRGGRPFHQMAYDQEPGGERRAGCAAHPCASAGPPQCADPRLYL